MIYFFIIFLNYAIVYGHNNLEERIAHTIWYNESGCDKNKLLWWNNGEDFLSCGIGHFIWYPTHHITRFEETFPLFINYIAKKHIKIPDSIKKNKYICPWNNKTAFLHAQQQDLHEIYNFLANTMAEQAEFMRYRLHKILKKIIKYTDYKNKKNVQQKINSLIGIPAGQYTLLDYLNFKGSGLDKHETYNNQGWGLYQVLLAMDDNVNSDPVAAFAATAKKILQIRIHNAPQNRQEKQWLAGWIKRINTYITF